MNTDSKPQEDAEWMACKFESQELEAIMEARADLGP
jgi:hypothetical protein